MRPFCELPVGRRWAMTCHLRVSDMQHQNAIEIILALNL
jgi:hypothetical protein